MSAASIANALAATLAWRAFGARPDAIAIYPWHDGPPLPPGFGSSLSGHWFGDFSLPLAWASVPNPWTDYTRFPNTYPPGAMWIFRFLTLFDYVDALLLFLCVALFAMLLPLLMATRTLAPVSRTWTLLVLGVASLPTLAVLDRGNIQALLAPLLFGFAELCRRKRWLPACLLISVAGLLKVYPLLLLVLPLAHRKWREAASAAGLTVFASALMLAAFPGSFLSTWGGLRDGLHAFQHLPPLEFGTGNFSLAGGAAAVGLLMQGPDSSAAGWIAAHAWFIGGAYMGATIVALARQRAPELTRLILTLSLTQMVVPVSRVYSLAWAVVAAALVVMPATGDRLQRFGWPTIAAVAAALVPIAVPVQRLTAGPQMSWTSMLSPALLTGLTVMAIIARPTAVEPEGLLLVSRAGAPRPGRPSPRSTA